MVSAVFFVSAWFLGSGFGGRDGGGVSGSGSDGAVVWFGRRSDEGRVARVGVGDCVAVSVIKQKNLYQNRFDSLSEFS